MHPNLLLLQAKSVPVVKPLSLEDGVHAGVRIEKKEFSKKESSAQSGVSSGLPIKTVHSKIDMPSEQVDDFEEAAEFFSDRKNL